MSTTHTDYNKSAAIFSDLVEEIAKESFRLVRTRKALSQEQERLLTPAQFITRKAIAAILAAGIGQHPSPGDLENRVGVEKLVKEITQRVTGVMDLNSETLKMQCHLDHRFENLKDETPKKRRERERLATTSIFPEIVNAKSKAVGALEQLYKKIVTYVVIVSNLGQPTDLIVVKETSAALESIFPMSELTTFVSLEESEKSMQLKGLAQLVVGIRLFNRSLGKSGAGIPDFPYDCKSQATASLNLLNVLGDQALDYIKKYTTALQCSADLKQKIEDGAAKQKEARDALVFYWQKLTFINNLKEQLETKLNELKELNKQFAAGINLLRLTCRSKSAVPVEQVYPQFLALAPLWMQYEEMYGLIAGYGSLARSLQYFGVNAEALTLNLNQWMQDVGDNTPNFEFIDMIIEQQDFPDQEIVENVAKIYETAKVDASVQILHPNMKEFAEVTKEGQIGLAGFCPTSLLVHGLLLPGTPNYGIVHNEAFDFIFYSSDAVAKFCADPTQMVYALRTYILKEMPPLARLMELDLVYVLFSHNADHPLYNIRKQKTDLPDTTMVTAEGNGVTMGTQTDTHIAYDGQPYKYRKYMWNEWDLRRQAIQLVNMRNHKTKAQQTLGSHFRRDVDVQCWVHGKQKGTQTRRDTGAGQPKTIQYIKGLRGKKEPNQMSVVDLVLEF